MPPRPTLRLLPTEERLLRRWAAEEGGGSRRARRARIVLELARGASHREIAHRTGLHPETVARWHRRFLANRIEGLQQEAPRVRPYHSAASAIVERIVRTTKDQRSPDGRPWTTRSLARELRVNHMLVHRVWQSHGLPDPSALAGEAAMPATEQVGVAGVFFEGPAVVVFSLERAESTPSGPSPSGRVPNASVSGAYRAGAYVRSALGLLATLGHAHQTIGPRTGAERGASHELLVFLRSIDGRSLGRSEFHAFFDVAPPELNGRIDAWLATHPRFRAHYPRPGETWTASIDRWLREVPLRPGADDRIRVTPTFNESLARVFAARFPGDAT
ncbi:MAG: helix-turn-helix domain-containing protein [Thermoplasmata archaeon]